MRASIEEFKESVRLELTQQLLDSVFALGDGRRVTWGEATIVDHQQGVEMLTTKAIAIGENAAHHLAAIALISRAGASCLREINQGIAV
jgi:hypothetical protein